MTNKPRPPHRRLKPRADAVSGPVDSDRKPHVAIRYRLACEARFKTLRFAPGTRWVQARRWIYAHLGLASRKGRGAFGSQILRGYEAHAWESQGRNTAEANELSPLTPGQSFVLVREPTSERTTRDDIMTWSTEETTEEERMARMHTDMTREWVSQPKREQRVKESQERPKVPLGIPTSQLRPAETPEEKARAFVDAAGNLLVRCVGFADGIIAL